MHDGRFERATAGQYALLVDWMKTTSRKRGGNKKCFIMAARFFGRSAAQYHEPPASPPVGRLGVRCVHRRLGHGWGCWPFSSERWKNPKGITTTKKEEELHPTSRCLYLSFKVKPEIRLERLSIKQIYTRIFFPPFSFSFFSSFYLDTTPAIFDSYTLEISRFRFCVLFFFFGVISRCAVPDCPRSSERGHSSSLIPFGDFFGRWVGGLRHSRWMDCVVAFEGEMRLYLYTKKDIFFLPIYRKEERRWLSSQAPPSRGYLRAETFAVGLLLTSRKAAVPKRADDPPGSTWFSFLFFFFFFLNILLHLWLLFLSLSRCRPLLGDDTT